MARVAAGPEPQLALGTTYQPPSRTSPFPSPLLGGCSAPRGTQRDAGVGTCHSKEKPAAGDRAEPAGLRGLVWSCLNT